MIKLKNKILILGNNGEIGSFLETFLKQEFMVSGLDIKNGFDIACFDNINRIDFEKFDVIINCAYKRCIEKDFYNKTSDFISEYFNVNLVSPINIINCAVNNNFKGKILFFSSIAVNGMDNIPFYSAAKSGLESFIKSSSKQLFKKHIHSYIIRLGPVNCKKSDFSEQYKKEHDEIQENILKFSSKHKKIEKEEVLNIIKYIINDDYNSFSGQVFPLDGGYGIL